MSILKSITVKDIIQRGSIRDGDVARLQAACTAADCLAAEDAEALFELHASCPIQDPTWSRFFVDALCDYVVNQARPEGYAVAENARWLIERTGRFGRIETSTELALLVGVLEMARWSPPSLAAYALAQIRQGIATGSGPLRANQGLAAGTITLSDVDLAARIIQAFGHETNLPLTRAEADELIAINRAIAPGQSTPAWSGLLVRTIGSAVLAATGHAVPPRREILDATNTANTAPELVGDGGSASRFRAAASAPRFPASLRVWSSSPILSAEERALARLERQRHEIVTNEVIEEATDVWLMARLSEVARPNDNEASILAFITREATRLPPALAEFAARVAVAA